MIYWSNFCSVVVFGVLASDRRDGPSRRGCFGSIQDTEEEVTDKMRR